VGNEREQDRWLKAGLRQPPAPASADCLDAETLAAFADGGLNAQASAAVELHASSCTRCTAVLAAMERSAPARAATHAWTPARVMRWLIPLTAAATAVAIWVAVPERPITSVVDDLKTTTQEVPVPIPVPGSVPVPDSRSGSIVLPETANRNPAPSTQNREPDARTDASSQRFAPEALRDAAGATAAQETAPASPPSPPVAAPAEPVPGLAREERAAAPARSADTFAETVAPTAQRRALAAKVVATSESTAPNELFRWRVINSTSIERSVDGGKTWAETIPLPRDSVKGLTIAGIRAASDLHATVRMSNGSEFYTADGGKSWILLQEK
jgi:hypothetical protein